MLDNLVQVNRANEDPSGVLVWNRPLSSYSSVEPDLGQVLVDGKHHPLFGSDMMSVLKIGIIFQKALV